MRMWQKQLLIYVPLIIAFIGMMSGWPGGPYLFALVVVLFLLQWPVLKCPHCGEASFRRPGKKSGALWAGYECRYCGKEY
jgi:hypothetical protein